MDFRTRNRLSNRLRAAFPNSPLDTRHSRKIHFSCTSSRLNQILTCIDTSCKIELDGEQLAVYRGRLPGWPRVREPDAR